MTAHRYSLDELNAGLHQRAFALCEAIFGHGNVLRAGHQAWIRNPLRKDPNWTSFSFNLVNDIWKDFSDASGETAGKGGLSLIAMFATRGEYKSERDASGAIVRKGAVQWAMDFLGLTGQAPDAAEARAMAERAAHQAREAEILAAKSRAGALRYWTEAMKKQTGASPLTGFDPASLYLAGRGIDVTRMREGFPRALAFHPAVWAQDPDPGLRGPWPALIACISLEGLPQGFAALHRTYLRLDADGRWVKRCWDRCKTGKQVKGRFAGGSIRLTRGLSGKVLRDAPADEWVQIVEGIEDGLTVAIAEPDMRTLVGVSVSNIGGLALPETVKHALVWKQNDDEPAAIAQFDRAMDQLAARGIEPVIAAVGEQFKDPNDVLVGKVKASA